MNTGGVSRDRPRSVARMRRLSAFHAAVLRRTRGRFAARAWAGSDIVLLTTTGRRSGRRRTVPLMALREGEDFFVVSSGAGMDRQPEWWLNLQADPQAEIEVRGKSQPVVASALAGAERAEVWARFVASAALFERYQSRVDREIAVVRLRPARD
jgi:F420H(2)-dependent quinone reductase